MRTLPTLGLPSLASAACRRQATAALPPPLPQFLGFMVYRGHPQVQLITPRVPRHVLQPRSITACARGGSDGGQHRPERMQVCRRTGCTNPASRSRQSVDFDEIPTGSSRVQDSASSGCSGFAGSHPPGSSSPAPTKRRPEVTTRPSCKDPVAPARPGGTPPTWRYPLRASAHALLIFPWADAHSGVPPHARLRHPVSHCRAAGSAAEHRSQRATRAAADPRAAR